MPDQNSLPIPTVSIIIPVHGGDGAFRKCLQSVTAAAPPPDELIVVADGGMAEPRQVAQAFEVNMTALPGSQERAKGPAAARNYGACKATGEILFFLDADVAIPPDIIGQVVSFFKQNNDIAAVFGSYDDTPGETNFLSQYRNLLHHYVHQTGKKTASTFWGACGAIRRKAFLEMNGFDECFTRPSIEDIELGNRLVRAGHKIVLKKDLQVTHLKRWSARAIIYTDFFYRALPWARLILRNGDFINDLNLKVKDRFSVACVWLSTLALVAGLHTSWLLPPALAAGFVVLALNFDLYRFFNRQRGASFALRAAFWHWLYYLYSGLAFFIGVVESVRKPGKGANP